MQMTSQRTEVRGSLHSHRERLDQTVRLLEKSLLFLRSSLEDCRAVGSKQVYSDRDFLPFEALARRFARTSDILIKMAFRILDSLDLEDEGSPLDRINRSHKRGLVQDEFLAREIRSIRLTIDQDYKVDDLMVLWQDVLRLTPALIEMCECTLAHMKPLTRS